MTGSNYSFASLKSLNGIKTLMHKLGGLTLKYVKSLELQKFFFLIKQYY